MVTINYAFREVVSKIVYYGPGLSGKTTNLQYVFAKVPAKTKGEMISLATEADRTLYFDFLPLTLGTIQGFTTKFQLYTVPGQVFYNATRKLVLRGVDGLVFVADSQLAKMDENIESLNNLKENLVEYGYNYDEIPLVIQYNKRDLPAIAPLDQLESILNPRGVPYFEGVASKGKGVFDTLKAICKIVLDKAKSETGESSEETGVAGIGQSESASLMPKPVDQPVSQNASFESADKTTENQGDPFEDNHSTDSYKSDETSSPLTSNKEDLISSSALSDESLASSPIDEQLDAKPVQPEDANVSERKEDRIDVSSYQDFDGNDQNEKSESLIAPEDHSDDKFKIMRNDQSYDESEFNSEVTIMNETSHDKTAENTGVQQVSMGMEDFQATTNVDFNTVSGPNKAEESNHQDIEPQEQNRELKDEPKEESQSPPKPFIPGFDIEMEADKKQTQPAEKSKDNVASTGRTKPIILQHPDVEEKIEVDRLPKSRNLTAEIVAESAEEQILEEAKTDESEDEVKPLMTLESKVNTNQDSAEQKGAQLIEPKVRPQMQSMKKKKEKFSLFGWIKKLGRKSGGGKVE